jgi:hypothetical protein
MEGVKKSMRDLKNNKAAVKDNTPELIKYGGNKLLNRIYGVVCQILEGERI